MSYRCALTSTIASVSRKCLTWTLAVLAIATPLVYQHYLEKDDARRIGFDLAAENAAAVTFDRWQREGRLQTAAGDHPMLDLDITRSDWEALSPKARTALQRRLARAVIRGTRVERYVIHEGATLLARSTEN